MAVRLARWLRTESQPGVSVADFAREYIRDLSFVDWARSQLSRDATSPDLTSAYQRLDAEVTERRETLATLTEFDVRPRDPERELSTLSGGNAQKVLLAKWLSVQPDIVVLNEPTTGVDVGAREEIYAMVRRAAAAGTTVLVASSDFEEIVRLCSRACIFAGGTIVRELSGRDLTIETVTTAAGQGVRRSEREG